MPKTSKRKPNLVETDDGDQFVSKRSFDFPNRNNFTRCSHYTWKRPVLGERFNQNIQYFLIKLVIEGGTDYWLDGTNSVTKQSYNTKQSSTKLTATQAYLEEDAENVCRKFLDTKNFKNSKYKNWEI